MRSSETGYWGGEPDLARKDYFGRQWPNLFSIDAQVYYPGRHGVRTMATATLTFRRCVMNSPEAGADDRHVGARVYFDLDVEGRQHPNLFADVREPIGIASHEEFLEVTRPHNYTGPLNVPVFQGLVEFYYRHVMGSGLILGAKPPDKKFVGYVLEQEMQVQFEVS